MSATVKPPVWFWIVSVIFLLWALAGVSAYWMSVNATVESLAAQGYNEAQIDVMMSAPKWMTALFAISVFGSFIGAIGLLLRKGWSKWLFALSLTTILIGVVYSVIAGVYGIMGTFYTGFDMFVVLMGVLMLVFAHSAKKKGWIA